MGTVAAGAGFLVWCRRRMSALAYCSNGLAVRSALDRSNRRLRLVVAVMVVSVACLQPGLCDGKNVTCYCTRNGPADEGNIPCSNNTCRINTGESQDTETGHARHHACRLLIFRGPKDEYKRIYDCFSFDGTTFALGFLCLANKQPDMSCCQDNDNCNRQLLPPTVQPSATVVTTATPTASNAPGISTTTVVAISVIGLCLLVASSAVICYCRIRQKAWVASSTHVTTNGISGSESSGHVALDGDSSGRGLLELEMRTISREFELLSKISTGRYGDVYKASWRGRFVAIKMFKLKDEEAFKWEKGLYWMYGLHHNHLVEFIAADTRDCQLETQQWLVTAHHGNGTLLQFLRHVGPDYNFPLACQLGRSIASGLAYLHSSIAGAARCARSQNAPLNDVMGMGNKPSIAHCALSSDVILIKDDFTCCLSDLTMATQLSNDSNVIQHSDPVLSKAGAYRYMAPELMDDSLNKDLFESYRQLDMYAFALLLWEIMWCCPVSGRQQPHRLPYDGIVPLDASLADWTHIVSHLLIRPPLVEDWKQDATTWRFANLMKSCWNAHAHGRRTALNATKALQSCFESQVTTMSAADSMLLESPSVVPALTPPSTSTCYDAIETSI